MTIDAAQKAGGFSKNEGKTALAMPDPLDLLVSYFQGEALETIILHGRAVAGLAVDIGRSLALDGDELAFLDQAGLLHDIGVCRVHAPKIGLNGKHPYIMHGVIGRDVLESEGMPRHALVSERHIGVGLNQEDIINQQLPLPLRDMIPTTLSEEIICFADLFYSKTPGKLEQRKSPQHVREKLAKFGEHKVQIFDGWLLRFGGVL
ncbi:HD domain-containing protein [Geobacter sp. SVR]|uniref:HD domain-containing protein n=1 Tax=Geobacter sp. SVR TaxID=2495594 RepID=UPI00143EF91C|nr:HD domain-containing protein [Geobacter sp. SVR]BCS54470.1 HD family phosphohydrolase [Geobacter sp. SVR]GCF87069.1 HD family phosphohydrolase [Geobacter sp. SVR]